MCTVWPSHWKWLSELFHINGWSWLMLHIFLNPVKQATASIREPQPLYVLLSGSRPTTSSSQPRFTAWLHLRIPKPSTSSSHLSFLYNSGRVALAKTKVGADLGLHHPGNHRACTPSGQLPTTLENHPPISAQLILHGWQGLVVNSQ